MVFCGLFPIETERYEDLREALDKLSLNDAALSYEPETSQALGFGFRCGFLGLLHMDIVRERLEREYDLEMLATTPNVSYEVELIGDEVIEVHSPVDLPDPGSIVRISEPYIRASVLCPSDKIGAVMELCQERRGTHVDMHYLSSERVQLRYDLPLGEIVLDFFDQLKSRTAGYASLDYEPTGMAESDLVKLDVLLAGDPVDALSIIVHRDKAYDAGKVLVERLRKTIPRQQFDVPVQAAVGSRVLARETVKAVRKDVTAKLYGGDVTRKRKLLEKQKKGKKRMKQVGRVEVPQEAFLAVLELDQVSDDPTHTADRGRDPGVQRGGRADSARVHPSRGALSRGRGSGKSRRPRGDRGVRGDDGGLGRGMEHEPGRARRDRVRLRGRGARSRLAAPRRRRLRDPGRYDEHVPGGLSGRHGHPLRDPSRPRVGGGGALKPEDREQLFREGFEA